MRFVTRRRRLLPQTDTYHARRKRRAQWLAWGGIGASIAVLIMTVSAPLWLPPLLRATIPSRYLVAYAPQPLLEMIFENDPLQTLPTISGTPIDLNSVVLPTPLPTIANPVQQTGSQPDTAGTGSTGGSVSGDAAPGFVQVGGQASAGSVVAADGSSAQLTGFVHTFQGWNNCGPATLSIALSYWGIGASQANIAAFVKPDPEDRNVRPDELVAFVHSEGYEATVRINGSLDLLKRLIRAGYPVIVQEGFDPEPDRLGWMGHYLLLTGYNDAAQSFNTMDSYLGPNESEAYSKLDRYWRHFDRTYIVAYPPDQESEIAGLIGADMDDQTMYANALTQALNEKDQNPGDPFAWFNLGTIYVALGDYDAAATSFDLARERGTPWRMLWYEFGPYEAYLHVGGNRLYDVTTLADAVLKNNVYSEEAYYYKGLALQALGEATAARNEFNKALHYNPHYTAAYQALQALGDG